MNNQSAEIPSMLELRAEIDHIDRELFTLIARRMSVAIKIGTVKRELGIPIKDPVREAQLKLHLKEFAADVLEPRHVEKLAAVLIRISRDLQTTESADK